MGNSEKVAGDRVAGSKYKFIIDYPIRKTATGYTTPHYSDISVLGVLKTLLKEHKIHTTEYKTAIRRFTNRKPLPNSIYSKIHFYLCSLKSRLSETTLTAITTKQNTQQKRFISISYQNQKYAVNLKKQKFKQYTQNTALSTEYKDLMLIAIQKEFNKKISTENDIFGGCSTE
jgi:hypothetical protein